MPRERVELFRESDSIEKERIIVLAFEGNDTERIYFEDFKASDKFNDSLIFLKLLTRSKNDTNSAPNHVFEKLKKEAKDEFNFNENDELWMIIDTDRWKTIPKIIQACKEEGNMFVAVSNPCFEFWLLLHVKNIEDYSAEELELILKNKKVSQDKRYVDSQLTAILGSYNKSKPRTELYFPTLDFAISQARKLNNSNEEYPKGLGSQVYKVMEKILKESIP
jgi:hypothetical protein